MGALQLLAAFNLACIQCWQKSMFNLVLIKDVVRVVPSKFNAPQKKALIDEINYRFANKVIYNVGLCIFLHDITKIGDSFIYPNDGASYTQVEFRMIVFRPFVGEILVGKIVSSSEEGLKISMGFFDDITVPVDNFSPKTSFNKEEQVWVWQYGGSQLYLDIHEKIVFKVSDENFTDVPPKDSVSMDNMSTPTGDNTRAAPYAIKASLFGYGLGAWNWWHKEADNE